jgi:glucose/arabinose dehydrogenase
MRPIRQTVRLVALAAAAGGLFAAPARAQAPGTEDRPASAYHLETIQTPEGQVPETGGVDFLPDGRLVSVFHHGEVLIYDPATKDWSVFATGLHDPLGVVVINDREMIVGQRPEVTRLIDSNGDGKADVFETVSDEFGMSGNYSEFLHGPVRDSQGNLYFSLNTASNNGPVRPLIRGDYSPRGRIGRMFSAVEYRGWIMKITPEGETIPWASGFRSPNGMTIDRDGNLFVTDNQGDWLGTSKLYHVQPHEWHGHPPSLAWEEGIHTMPLAIPVPVLNRMRVKEIVQFPNAVLANSPTQPIFDYTGGKFGPFEGQMFVGEMNHPVIMRVMLEEVNHELQGAVAPFIEGPPLRLGSNRLAFAPDGSLWVGHTDHGWLGDKGITRITWSGDTPLEVLTMKLTEDGFDLNFTEPVDRQVAAQAATYDFIRYFYEYSINYGAPQSDKQAVAVENVEVSADGRNVRLKLAELKPGYVYEMNLKGMIGMDGAPMVNTRIYYTLNQLKQPAVAPPAFSAAGQ